MRVKELHDHYCQVCGERIETPAGPYAEAAHVRLLGRPHDGPDVIENVLCLCPNDHKRFDFSSIYIEDDYSVRDTTSGEKLGRLSIVRGHAPDPAHLRYHREHTVRA
jgi:putative restriction endonuclease